jgi:hypothetical protein
MRWIFWIGMMVLTPGAAAQVTAFDFNERPRSWANMAPIDGHGESEWAASGGRTGGALHVSAAGVEADAIRLWKTVLSKPAPPAGRRLRVRAWIKGTDVETVAGLNVRAHTSGESYVAGFASTQAQFPLKGTFDWTEVHTELDVPRGTANVQLLAMLVGNGEVWFDDVSAEVGEEVQLIVPGVFEVRGSDRAPAGAATVRLAVPTDDADQCPVSYKVTVEPPARFVAARVERNDLGRWEARVELGDGEECSVRWAAVVVVGPTDFSGMPRVAPLPSAWPKGFRHWCAEEMATPIDPAVVRLAAEIRGGSNDSMEILGRTLEHMRSDRGGRPARPLEDALLLLHLARTNCMPARLVEGVPAWEGPTAARWLVEVCVRAEGWHWYPIEPTLLRGAWPNHQWVRLAVLQGRDEAALAAPGSAANEQRVCEPVRNFNEEMDGARWAAVLEGTRRRWSGWLEGARELEQGVAAPGQAREWFQGAGLEEIERVLKGT